MESVISAIGTAVPAYIETQSAFCQFLIKKLELAPDFSRKLKAIYRGTGIKQRHTVINEAMKNSDEFDFFSKKVSKTATTSQRMQIYKDNALPLALTAINNCFSSKNNFNQNNISHLITVSCTGMYAPGLDIEIIQNLKLSSSIQRTAVNFMGCYGVFNALKLAHAICKFDSKAKVLIVSVELCSIHFQQQELMDNLISAAIFSDGAAAILVESQNELQNQSQDKFLILKGFHCDILEQSHQAMAWNISDHGFDIILSSYVPELIKSGISNFASKLFNRLNLEKKDIHYYAIHPGGYKILQATEQALELSKEDNRYAYEILKNYGNMSSATIAFVLKKIWEDLNKSSHHKNIFCSAFGPGLTLESMILKIHHV